MVDGPADGGAPVGQLLDRRIGKNDARSHRELLEEDLRVGEEHARRGPLVLDDDLRVLVVALAQPVQRAHWAAVLPEPQSGGHGIASQGNMKPLKRMLGKRKKKLICIACCCVCASVEKKSPSARLAAMKTKASR